MARVKRLSRLGRVAGSIYSGTPTETLRERREARKSRASNKARTLSSVSESRGAAQSLEVEKATNRESSRVKNKDFKVKFEFTKLLDMAEKIKHPSYRKDAVEYIRQAVRQSAADRKEYEAKIAYWEDWKKTPEGKMFYKNPCKANPRRRKASKRKAKAGSGSVARKLSALATQVKKLAKKVANPRMSFPKTSRGRKPKVRGWVLEMYGAGGKKLGGHIIKRTKAAAEKVAASGVGKNFRGKRIHRVVLDGPH